MKTLQQIKSKLTKSDGANTILGMHINSLLGKDINLNCGLHNIEMAMEIMVQMEKNGIDVFEDTFKMGSVDKAYYQLMVEKYSEY